MKFNTTYLCGGINGLSDSECRDWRETAKEMLHTATLDPMRRDYRGQEKNFFYDIVTGDKEDIVASQFVLVNADRPSWGTAMEVFYAKQIGRIVIAFCSTPSNKISPWLRYHCTSIWPSVEVACNEINRLYQK